jgi:hypothetical protein
LATAFSTDTVKNVRKKLIKIASLLHEKRNFQEKLDDKIQIQQLWTVPFRLTGWELLG